MTVRAWRPGLCVLCAKAVKVEGRVVCIKHEQLPKEAVAFLTQSKGARADWTWMEAKAALDDEAHSRVMSGEDHL